MFCTNFPPIKTLKKEKKSFQVVKAKKKELRALKQEAAGLKKQFRKENRALKIIGIVGVVYVGAIIVVGISAICAFFAGCPSVLT